MQFRFARRRWLNILARVGRCRLGFPECEGILRTHPFTEELPKVYDKPKEVGLPNLRIPSTASLFEMKHLLLPGSGKPDLQSVKYTAIEHFTK